MYVLLLFHIITELKIAIFIPKSEPWSGVIPLYSLHTYFPSFSEKKSRKKKNCDVIEADQLKWFGSAHADPLNFQT